MHSNISLGSIKWTHYIKPSAKELQELWWQYDFHELVMEDLVQLNTQPKIDIYDDHLFLVLHFPKYDNFSNKYIINEFNIILGKDYIVSVASHPTKYIDKIIQEYTDDVKYASEDYKISPYYVLYVLIDQMYEKSIKSIWNIASDIYKFNDLLFKSKIPQKELLEKMVMKKINITLIRHSFEPQEEIMEDLVHAMTKMYDGELEVYFEDLWSKLTKIIRHAKVQYENIDNLTDTYNTLLSMHHNSVITILTIVTSIFIPLTFIVGIYGMNFQSQNQSGARLPLNMPELYSPYGYVVIMIIMCVIAIGQLFYFRRRKRI
jgi:magnesium transporter